MKLGILTYHRSHNNGALLQALALREFLCSLGHNVSFIDYWPKYHKSMYALYDVVLVRQLSPLKKLKYLIRNTLILPKKIIRRRAFNSFIRKNIEPFTLNYNDNIQYDAIIYGSDQIWRKQGRLKNKYNEIYFGENSLSADMHISYAASMGEVNLSLKDKKFLYSHLSKYVGVGVREKDLYKELKDIDLTHVNINIDPTFLLPVEFWYNKFNLKPLVAGSYVLFFNLMSGSFNKEMIEDYAKRKGLKLIILEGAVNNIFRRKDTLETVGPVEFLSLIKNAEVVFTSSFHALAFSIIFQKQFWAAFKCNSERARTLLNELKIENRLIDGTIPLEDVHSQIDYELVRSQLDILVDKSKKFLMNSIK